MRINDAFIAACINVCLSIYPELRRKYTHYELGAEVSVSLVSSMVRKLVVGILQYTVYTDTLLQ